MLWFSSFWLAQLWTPAAAAGLAPKDNQRATVTSRAPAPESTQRCEAAAPNVSETQPSFPRRNPNRGAGGRSRPELCR